MSDNGEKRLAILGCGYVGTAVAQQAIKRGWQVSALTRNPERVAALRTMGVSHVVKAELDSTIWHPQIDPQQDYVLNCVSSAGGGLAGYEKSYVEGQRSILQWASQGRIGTLVYTSATSVYPQSDGELVDEDSVPGELSGSGGKLRESEDLLLKRAPDIPLGRSIILRLGGIYGPGRHYLLDKLIRGESTFPGRGDIILNYIHLDDIVSAVFSALLAPPQIHDRVYNVVDGTYPTKEEIVQWLAEQLGKPRPVFDPEQQTQRAGRRLNAAGKLPNRRVSNRRIGKELGWEPAMENYRAGYAPLLK